MAKRTRTMVLVHVEFPTPALYRSFTRFTADSKIARRTTGGYIEVLDALRFRQILDACEGTVMDERIEEYAA